MRASAALALLVLALAGCVGAEDEATGALSAADAAGFPPIVPNVVEATILDGAFDPGRTTIAPGTTVVWSNTDDKTHSVVSDDGSFAGSGPLGPTSTFSHTFERPGDYAYHCRFHPEMTGSLLVR